MGKNVDSVAYECSNKRVRGKGVALEYYFRAIDEFTILIPQLDETFSFFFFFGKAFFDAIIPFLFFGEISFSMDGDIQRDIQCFKGWNVDRSEFKSDDVSG